MIIFFIVASASFWICEQVLKTHGYFSYCWTVSHSIKASEEAGGAKDLRGHSPDQVMWSAIKTVGKKEEGEAYELMAFVFPKNYHTWCTSAFLGMAKHLPAHGKWSMNSVFCFACVCKFCFIYQVVITSTHEFSLLLF